MPVRFLSTACLLYLLLPCLLFLAGWVQPYVAWPVGLALFGAVLWVATQCPAKPLQWNTGGALRLGLILLLGAAWVLTTGPWGIVEQSGDATVRNAVYASLVRDSWPLTVGDEPFIYYLAFWLPPALAAKLGAPAEAALLLWMLLGMWLALLAVAAGKGTRRTLVFLCILFLMGDMMNWANRIYFKLLADSGFTLSEDWTLFLDLHFTPSCVQLRNTFNHYLAPLILMGLLLGKLLPTRYGAAAAALVVICSPLAVIALIPLLLLRAGHRILNIPTLVAGLYATLPLLYLAGGAGGQFAFMRPGGACSLAALSEGQLWFRYAVQLLFILGPALLFLWRWRHTSWFISAVILTATLPLVWIGLWNNEFIYKGASIMWLCLAWLYSSAWCHFKNAAKALLALFLLLSASDAYGQLMGALKSFSCHPETMQQNIRDEWKGSLNQPGDLRASQFKGKLIIPELFKF